MEKGIRRHKHAKTTLRKLAEILDSLAMGGTYREIGKRAGTSNSHVLKIAKDFPLWKWASGHDPREDEDD